MTRVFKAHPENPELDAIRKAAGIIKSGGLVAFPTETVYGLGADAFDPEAVRKIFEAKGRPLDNPIIVHIADKAMIEQIAVDVPPAAQRLIDIFWPGPLTLVLKKRKEVPYEVTGWLDTVAVRMPDHPVALALIKKSGVPIAAPSANISGRPSPTRAEHVIDDFMGKIDCIIDGGASRIGIESTVLDLTSEVPTILRPGFITPEDIRDVIGNVCIHPAVIEQVETIAKSPGMKYRHYAPEAEMILFEGTREGVLEEIEKRFGAAGATRKMGVLLFDDIPEIPQEKKIIVGASGRTETYCRIYDALREFDRRGVGLILAQGCEPEGFGLAIMNRLRRAAGYNIVKVK